jgi:iron complex transport system substrate-binding protein
MKIHPFRIWMVLLIGIAISCSAPQSQKKEHSLRVKPTATIQYANGFEFDESRIIIKQPWPGATHPQTFELNTDIKRIVVTGTTMLPYLEMLNIGDKLVGFPGTQYIYAPYFRARVQEGLIKDLGPDGSLNLEILFDLEPDLVIAFDMGTESTQLDKIKEAGIPLLYNSDYLESSVLGRAEWIKVFGVLFNRQTMADSIFNQIAGSYESILKKTSDFLDKPTVLSGIMYGETWFLPGGQNGSAQLIRDAGGHYLWDETDQSGWLELSFETVIDKGEKAEFWIGTGTIRSRDELKSLDQRYSNFNAFRTGKVFNYSKRIGPGGGYDYFESGYARPDLILADLAFILHPEIWTEHNLVYFQTLE